LLEKAGLDHKAKKLLAIIRHNPYKPPFEKLTRDLRGCFSRRINKQHQRIRARLKRRVLLFRHLLNKQSSTTRIKKLSPKMRKHLIRKAVDKTTAFRLIAPSGRK